MNIEDLIERLKLEYKDDIQIFRELLYDDTNSLEDIKAFQQKLNSAIGSYCALERLLRIYNKMKGK